ncbi:MAG: dockerin type I domain-containing protein [Dehalococcoidia bacterium]
MLALPPSWAPLRVVALAALCLVGLLATLLSPGRPAEVLGAGAAASVAGGGAHSCVVTDAGQVKCWGWNFYGQLGDGTTDSRAEPVDVCADAACSSLLSGVVAVAGGDTHSCAASEAGGVWCWGRNVHGRLGDGTEVQRNTPVAVCAPVAESEQCGALGGIVGLAGGFEHTCAVTGEGGVYCWGSNELGQLGNGTRTSSKRPVAVCEPGSESTPCAPLADAVALTAGWFSSCALRASGGVVCWGHNGHGQLGDDGACGTFCSVPTVAGVSDVVSIASGNGHVCVAMSSGLARCWGENSHGQLGDGTNTPRHAPVDVCVVGVASCEDGLPDLAAVAIAAGHSHACTLLVNGEVWCWGANSAHQLGDGTTNNSSLPVRVDGVGEVAQFAAGGSHTCAVSPFGGVRCWGFNGDGRLGSGDLDFHLVPVDVLGFGGEKPPTATPTATATPTDTHTPTFMPTSTPTATAQLVPGDANCDDSVTAVDAALILQLIAALLGSLPCRPQADVNADGAVTAVDAALVLQMVAGLI